MTPNPPHVLVDLRRPGLTLSSIDRILTSLAEAEAERSDLLGGLHFVVSEACRDAVELAVDASCIASMDHEPIIAANRALDAAANESAGLLVLSGTSFPSAASLLAMQQVFSRDPYFAFAIPRQSADGVGLITKLDSDGGDPLVATIPREARQALPEYDLIPDYVGDAVLIRGCVVRDFESLDERLATLWGGVRELIARARRVGFRCVVVNRATVTVFDRLQRFEAENGDRNELCRRYLEMPGLDEEWKHSSLHEYQTLLGRAYSASAKVSKTLLIDLSDLDVTFNGTSEAIIGLLWGFKGCRRDWQISLLVSDAAAKFHALQHYFPEFSIVWPDPIGRHTAVLRPIQPWSMAQLERLHRMGLFNFVMMFDTILNEIRVGAPLGLASVWAHLARSADGILYISRFTRDRFRTRFPLDESVDECVSHLAFHPGDYCRNPAAREGEFIFVVGNGYPHKWMEPTVRDLVDAFPYQQFRTLGYQSSEVPQLIGLPSGRLGLDAIDSLYSNAKVIVYPSQYEGFGFPVIRGLSYGKTVVARRSELLLELAERYDGPGRLLAYESREELVDMVGHVLHGLEVDPVPLGSALAPGTGPDSQVDIAERILAFIENRTSKPESSNWLRRQVAFEMAAVYHATRTD